MIWVTLVGGALIMYMVLALLVGTVYILCAWAGREDPFLWWWNWELRVRARIRRFLHLKG